MRQRRTARGFPLFHPKVSPLVGEWANPDSADAWATFSRAGRHTMGPGQREAVPAFLDWADEWGENRYSGEVDKGSLFRLCFCRKPVAELWCVYHSISDIFSIKNF